MNVIIVLFILWGVQEVCTFFYARLMKKHFNRKIEKGKTQDNRSIREMKGAKRNTEIKLWIDGFIRLKLFVLAYIPSHTIRKIILKHVYCMDIKKETVIYYGFEIREPWNIHIGKSVIGDKCILDGRMGIYIGDNVNFSSKVQIWTLQHSVNDSYFRCLDEGKAVTIKDRAWISSNSIILPGTVIEEGAVIAAGAVLTKNAEAFGIYAGLPAKKIAERNRNLEYSFQGKHYHFL